MNHPEGVLTDCGPCGKVLSIDPEWYGQPVDCPHCRASFVVKTFRAGTSSDERATISRGTLGSQAASGTAATLRRDDVDRSSGQPEEVFRDDKNTGVRLGRYELIRVLGQGAFGKVYLAADPELDRRVAIKLPTLSGTHQAAERFRKEARAVAKLRHPNIVAVFDHGQTKQHVYIVYEYVPGQTCQDLLASQRTEFDSTRVKVGVHWQREWIERVATLADALAYAADQKLVHRDIKPANIMIDTRGRPQIMDFGLAKALTGGVAATGGGIAGTPAYMSPEQARGESKIGSSSDQYSLAAVLFEALTGEKTVKTSGRAAIVEVSQRESLPTESLMSLESDLRKIIVKAMSTSPSDRYLDCSAFANDLRHYLQLEPIEGIQPSIGRRLQLWTRRNQSTAWASIAVVALLAIVALISTAFNVQLTNQREQLREALSLADVARLRAEEGQAEAQRQTQLAERQTELARLSEENAKVARLDAESALAKMKEAQSKTELARRETETALAEKLAASEKTKVIQSELNTVASQNQQLRYAERLVMAYGAIRRGNLSESRLSLNECPEPLRSWEWNWLKSLSQYSATEATRLTRIPKALFASLTPRPSIHYNQPPVYEVTDESPVAIDVPGSREIYLITKPGQPTSMAVEIRKQEQPTFGIHASRQAKANVAYQALMWNLPERTSVPMGELWAEHPACGVISDTNLVVVSGQRDESDGNEKSKLKPQFEVWECNQTPVLRIQDEMSTNWCPSFAAITQRNMLLGCTDPQTLMTWDMNDFEANVQTQLDFEVHRGPKAMRTNPDQSLTMIDSRRLVHLVSPTRSEFRRIGRHELSESKKTDDSRTATLIWTEDGRYLAFNEFQSSLGSIDEPTAKGTLFLPDGIELGDPKESQPTQIEGMKSKCFTVMDVTSGLQVALVPQPSTKITSLRKRNEQATYQISQTRKLTQPIRCQNEHIIMCRRLLRIDAIEFDPVERMIGFRDGDGGIWAYQTQTEVGKQTSRLPTKARIEQIASATGVIAVANDHQVAVLRYDEGRGYQEKVLKRMHTQPIKHLAINSPATRLLSLDQTGMIVDWDLTTDRPIQQFSVPNASQVAFTDKRGHLAVIATERGTLILRDVEKSFNIATLEAHAGKVTAIAVSLEQHAVFSAGEDRILRYIDAHTGQNLDQEVVYTRDILQHLAVDEAGSTLVGFSDQNVAQFDYESNEIRPTGSINSPAGIQLATPMPGQPRWAATDGRTVHLLDSATSRLVFSLPPQITNIVHLHSPSSRELSFITDDGTLHRYVVENQPSDE